MNYLPPTTIAVTIILLSVLVSVPSDSSSGIHYSLQVTIKTNLLAELKHQAPN